MTSLKAVPGFNPISIEPARSARSVAGPLLVLVLAPMLAVPALAQEPQELVSLINDFRSADEACGGGDGQPIGPLAPNKALSVQPAASGTQLQEALQASGYRPAKLQAMSVSGPADAQSAMQALKQRYCEPLRSQDFAEIGVSRKGNTWQVLLARPLLSPDLGDWQQVGKNILERVNEARAEPRTCGSRSFDAAPALTWNAKLGGAALAHSRDMAEQNYFSHHAPDGSQVSDRANRAGYSWQRIGENIAAGQGSEEQVMAGWLASPGHCSNIMNPDFTEMGAAYAMDKSSAAGSYWTQVFGKPR
ncbi:CAP domain-containing protein [Stutzerimonas zhaodongensis]|uniref:CAP domain-containing protein n=1 Tax=Stutzerimonas TaxID=2901164 RepID=UPI00388F15F5